MCTVGSKNSQDTHQQVICRGGMTKAALERDADNRLFSVFTTVDRSLVKLYRKKNRRKQKYAPFSLFTMMHCHIIFIFVLPGIPSSPTGDGYSHHMNQILLMNRICAANRRAYGIHNGMTSPKIEKRGKQRAPSSISDYRA